MRNVWYTGGTHSMKVTTYAPPFRSPFLMSLENLYSFDTYILAKMRKMSYFDPYLSSKLGKMYSFDPPFWPLKRVSSRRAVRSIPIRNLTEYIPPILTPIFITCFAFSVTSHSLANTLRKKRIKNVQMSLRYNIYTAIRPYVCETIFHFQ